MRATSGSSSNGACRSTPLRAPSGRWSWRESRHC
nr:MAG TPA: hypothetical protein [Bacteriophage sp.]